MDLKIYEKINFNVAHCMLAQMKGIFMLVLVMNKHMVYNQYLTNHSQPSHASVLNYITQ